MCNIGSYRAVYSFRVSWHSGRCCNYGNSINRYAINDMQAINQLYLFHDEATLQSFRQCHKCDTHTMVCYVHCVICGFIKLYKHDFEVIKYMSYNHLALGPVALGLGDHKPDIALCGIT